MKNVMQNVIKFEKEEDEHVDEYVDLKNLDMDEDS